MPTNPTDPFDGVEITGEHSPKPWRFLPDEGNFIVDANGYIVAEIPCTKGNPADGHYIVACINKDDR